MDFIPIPVILMIENHNKVSCRLLSMCEGHCRRASPPSCGLRLSGLEHGLVLTVRGLTPSGKYCIYPNPDIRIWRNMSVTYFRRSYMYPTLRYGFSKHFGSPHTNSFLLLFLRFVLESPKYC